MIYTIKQFKDKKFTDKMDQTRFIKEKLEELKAMKMAEYKMDSSVVFIGEGVSKEFEPEIEDIQGTTILVKTGINSTNIIDSHLDLHMPQIWNKTVKDKPFSYHLKQHEARFESVISNRAKSFNENMNFKDLGLLKDMPMVMNMNEFILDRAKMPFMFDAYVAGDVKEHSIGMRYIDLDIAFYDEDSQKEMDYFNEMKAKAVNPEVADHHGYFWVVNEAEKREGSAVVFGSNSVTPTISVKNYEPQKSTRKEAGQTTSNPETSFSKSFYL